MVTHSGAHHLRSWDAQCNNHLVKLFSTCILAFLSPSVESWGSVNTRLALMWSAVLSSVPLANRSSLVRCSLLPGLARARCPQSQMSVAGLRNDSCRCILNIRRHIPRSVQRDEVTFAAGSSDILSLFPPLPPLVSCPAVTMNLHRALDCLTGQTSRCVWHSSFIDELFFNCSRKEFSPSALTLADPWGVALLLCPHIYSACWEHSFWLIIVVAHTKNNLQGFLCFFLACHSLLILLHCSSIEPIGG